MGYSMNTDPPPFISQNSTTGGLGPFVVPGLNGTLGTSSTTVLAPQTNRQGILFFNPNATANIAICPATDVNGNALAAAINGGGSYTLYPLAEKAIYGNCGCAWNAIASAPSSSLTIWVTN
jgi:hypothetical protein